MSEKKKIGLFGFGTVGKGFYENLKRNSHIPAVIEKVCIKRLDLERIGHELYFTTDPSELLEDPSIDIIVEVIDDVAAAKNIVFEALVGGKPVISANKKMIAESLKDIDEWHQQFEPALLYEAAVGGGIPIISTIEDYFFDHNITAIRGILNGSSNYILHQMMHQKWSYDEALSEAQKRGFAETNPTLDVSGLDASYKLAILGYHAFGEIASYKTCELVNIDHVSSEEISTARARGKKIKPIATISRTEEGFHCSVKPEWIDPKDELFNVDNETNGIGIATAISGSHLLIGKGAGALPTGAAVLGDLKRILESYRYGIKRKNRNAVLV